jgi:hypothetical protein
MLISGVCGIAAKRNNGKTPLVPGPHGKAAEKNQRDL